MKKSILKLAFFIISILLTNCNPEDSRINPEMTNLKSGLVNNIDVDRFFDSTYISSLETALGEDLDDFATSREFEDYTDAEEDVYGCLHSEYIYAYLNQTSMLSTYDTYIAEIFNYCESGDTASAFLSLNAWYIAAGCSTSTSTYLNEWHVTVNIPFGQIDAACGVFELAKDSLYHAYPVMYNLEETIAQDILIYAKLLNQTRTTLKQVPNECLDKYMAKIDVIASTYVGCITVATAVGIFVNPFAGIAGMFYCLNTYNGSMQLAAIDYNSCLNNP